MDNEATKRAANHEQKLAEQRRIIDYLVRQKYPLGHLKYGPNADKDKAQTYTLELYGIPLVTLQEMEKEALVKEWARLAAVAAEQEQARFFNTPRAMADFQHWGMRAYWTVEEGVALLLGRAPEIVVWNAVKQEFPASAFAVGFKKLLDLANNHVGGILTNPVQPSRFLRWAQRFDQPVPDELATAVKKYSQFIGDWQDAYDKVRKEADDLTLTVGHYKSAYDDAHNKVMESIEQMRIANGVIQSQRLRMAALEQQLAEKSEEQVQPEELDEPALLLSPKPVRMKPVGGDVLTPIVWNVCYDIYEAGGRVTAGPVMAKLQSMAASEDPVVRGCLLSAVKGGVKWEPLSSESDDDQELNTNSLNQRIREWKRKTGLG